MPDPLPKVFICYASADNRSTNPRERWLDRVQEHLEPFKDDDGIEVFSDNELSYGEGWHERIQLELQQARVVILLVSAAFMASNYVRNHELPVILYRAKMDGLRIVPILVSPSAFDIKEFRFPDSKVGPDRIKLSKLQSAGTPKETLWEVDFGKQERILSDVATFVAQEARKTRPVQPVQVPRPKPTPAPSPSPSGGSPAPKISRSTDEVQIEPPPRISPVPGRVPDPVGMPAPRPEPTLTSRSAEPAVGSREFVNSLGMRFLPVAGTEVLFCIWPTRVQDYSAYAAASRGINSEWKDSVYEGVPVTPGPNHPVVNVSWEDARAFCRWLTGKERASGKISRSAEYRLPTDLEWSAAVGLKGEKGATPKDRDEKVVGVYPWGTSWPPPPGSGNFADETALKKFPGRSIIQGYDDGYATTSPVGTYAPMANGLYDLSGNVWEWCEDWHDGDQKYRVLRGGSWGDYGPRFLLSSYRSNAYPGIRSYDIGFRVVLSGGGSGSPGGF